MTPEEMAIRLIAALRDNDAWLYSIPHGHNEQGSAYLRDRAERIMVNALEQIGIK